MNMTVIAPPASSEREEQPPERTVSDYPGSVSTESGSSGMVQPRSLKAPSRLLMSSILVVVIVLQIASTTGLLLYFNMSTAQARKQSISEDLRCLGLLNAMEKDQTISDGLIQHFGEPCVRLAEGIKTYISKVTSNILSQHRVQDKRRSQPRVKAVNGGNRPSAHLTLRDSGPQGPTSVNSQGNLHQSCRHLIHSWGNQSFGSHLHNMTVFDGRLRIPQTGRYYLYAQVYFRYLMLSSGVQRTGLESQQVVQCMYKKTAYAQPIQLLKAVGTMCWLPDGENTLQSIYQGGMFELRVGDEIFISVSSPAVVHAEDSSSYFGAFRFDP